MFSSVQPTKASRLRRPLASLGIQNTVAHKRVRIILCFAIYVRFDLFGESKDVSYNRKEVKDHGEGGMLVGAAVRGRRVVIVDDVRGQMMRSIACGIITA